MKFINEFTNNTTETKRLTVTQSTPGDIIQKELKRVNTQNVKGDGAQHNNFNDV